MIDRVEKVFRSLERMRRFHGHFFNWYDLNELRVLEPALHLDGGQRKFCRTPDRAQAGVLRDAEGSDVLRARCEAACRRSPSVRTRTRWKWISASCSTTKRKLFTIGYHIGSNTVDNSYYDLLASESRLASFMAIAKDDVPVDHWFRLGRSLTAAGGTRTLLSWSGSMFEYLMPALVMQTFPFTLLDQTHKGSVRRQIAYGAERGVPWGVSESAYSGARPAAHLSVSRHSAFPILR